MSKLQKALQMLRNGHEPKPNEGKFRESADSQSSNAGATQADGRQGEQRRPGTRVRSRYLPEGHVPDEMLPDCSVRITAERLREQGLWPQDKDLDLVAQQFRRIKRPILNLAFGAGIPEGKNANVIMVTSALPRTGKTFCSFNLATSIATERDVGALLLDADVLKPNISRAFGLDNRVGLIDYLLDASVTIDNILIATNLFGIIVVPAGRQHDAATELLASRRMQQLVETLAARFSARAIVVDTPPLLLTNEAQVLAEHMGQIVLVVEAGASTEESVTHALDSLDRSKPINAILNKARGASFSEYGGDGYGYGYGYNSAPRRGRDDAQREK